MAETKVYVTLTVSDGGVAIAVNPWTVHVPPGDTVKWEAVGSDITSLSITFHPAPPSGWLARYFDFRRLTAPRFPRLKRSMFPTPQKPRKKYRIDIKFKDPNGGTRKASVDPDMVMDT